MCNSGDIEDEFHYVLKWFLFCCFCNDINDIRVSYLRNILLSGLKLIHLLSSEYIKTLRNLVLYKTF